jgi:cell division protein FtsN
MSGPAETSSRSNPPGRRTIEIRIELVKLLLAAAVLVVIAGAWLFFRPTETEAPDKAAAPAGRGVVREQDVAEDLTFFDRVGRDDASRPRPAPAPAPPAAGASPGVRRFAVQVFAGDPAAADRLRTRLAARGYQATVVPSGPNLARVRLGSYSSREEAEAAGRQISTREGLRTWVVPAS